MNFANDSGEKNNDDRNFNRVGVPALWFSIHERFFDFHTPLDTMEKLDIGRLVRFIEEARRVTRILCADQVSGVKQVGAFRRNGEDGFCVLLKMSA